MALDPTRGIPTAKYIRALNLVVSIIGSPMSYYLYNGHGDVSQLADGSGTVAKTYVYDAFGNERDGDAGRFR